MTGTASRKREFENTLRRFAVTLKLRQINLTTFNRWNVTFYAQDLRNVFLIVVMVDVVVLFELLVTD